MGVAFDADYRWFVMRYGGTMVGSLAVFGLRTTELTGEDDTVINQTRRFRSGGVPADWIIVSGDGYGNAIGITTTGSVLLSEHDTGAIVDIAAPPDRYASPGPVVRSS